MDPETNNTPQAPDLSQEEMRLPENLRGTEKASATPLNGALVGILILLLLFILGGLYVWFTQLTMQPEPTPTPAPVERPTAEENNEPESTTAEAVVETQQAVSTSDDLAAIEADIAATNLEALDAELNAIDAELEAALNAF